MAAAQLVVELVTNMAESEDSAESEESDVEWEDVEAMPNALIGKTRSSACLITPVRMITT